MTENKTKKPTLAQIKKEIALYIEACGKCIADYEANHEGKSDTYYVGYLAGLSLMLDKIEGREELLSTPKK